MAPRRQRSRPKSVKTVEGQRVDTGEKGVSGKDPFGGSIYLRRYAAYLGQWDGDAISLDTMAKMLRHPAIALADHIIGAPLIHASWDIECPDQNKRRFMKSVIEPIYLKMMLFSLPAIVYGFAAFTKQWGQYLPRDEKTGDVLWPKNLVNVGVLPVVPVDLKQLPPKTVAPIIENDEFKGINQREWGEIDPLYSMWITHHRHKVWGNLWGWPLLTNVYDWWWSSGFRMGLMNRHIEDRVSPPIVVYYPPGYVEDPGTGQKTYNREAALETGKAVRSGETIAMPSDWYVDDTGKPYGQRWDAKFLQGGENVDAFVTLEDASDVRILMGMLIPPQALLQAKGGIGSQSVAETLGEVFWDSQRIRKQEFDQQFTDYVVRPIERLNWPEGPGCSLVTRRFRREDQVMVNELLKLITNRQDVDLSELFDLADMVRRAGMPVGPMGQVMKQTASQKQAGGA